MHGVRTAGFVVLAIAAAVITFAFAPEAPEPADAARFDRLIDQALSDFEANESRADSAPQQQVVAGWATRDLLTIIAQQQTAALETAAPAATDDRVPLLLFVVVLAVVWHGATLPRPDAATPPDHPAATRSREALVVPDDDPADTTTA